MRIQNARNGHLHPSFVILSSLESCFPFLQEKIRVILSGEFSNLHQEVSEMVFEGWDVLVKVEETCHCNLDLIIC